MTKSDDETGSPSFCTRDIACLSPATVSGSHGKRHARMVFVLDVSRLQSDQRPGVSLSSGMDPHCVQRLRTRWSK